MMQCAEEKKWRYFFYDSIDSYGNCIKKKEDGNYDEKYKSRDINKVLNYIQSKWMEAGQKYFFSTKNK